MDIARPVLYEKPQHRRATWTAVHPDGQGGIFGFFAGLEEPFGMIVSEGVRLQVGMATHQKNVLML